MMRRLLAVAVAVFLSAPLLAQVCQDADPDGHSVSGPTKKTIIVCGSNKVCTPQGGQWVCTSGSTGTAPGGDDQELQFKLGNSPGVFGGADGATYSPSSDETRLKIVNGVRDLSFYAATGTGTSGSPWRGWQAAIASGATVKLKPGSYDIENTGIDLAGMSDVTIEGDGPGAVLLDGDSSSTTLINVGNCNRCTVRNLMIDGKSNLKSARAFGIVVDGGDNILIDNVTLRDIPGSCVRVVSTSGTADNVTVRGIRTEKVNAATYACDDLQTVDQPSLSAGYGFGVIVQNAPKIRIEDNTITDTEYSGIYFSSGSDGALIVGNAVKNPENGIRFYSSDLTVARNSVLNARVDAIRIGDGALRPVVTGNILDFTGSTPHHGIRVEGATSNFLFADNRIRAVDRAIYLWGFGSNSIDTRTAADGTISGNIIDGCQTTCITIRPIAQRISIFGNYVTGGTLFGTGAAEAEGGTCSPDPPTGACTPSSTARCESVANELTYYCACPSGTCTGTVNEGTWTAASVKNSVYAWSNTYGTNGSGSETWPTYKSWDRYNGPVSALGATTVKTTTSPGLIVERNAEFPAFDLYNNDDDPFLWRYNINSSGDLSWDQINTSDGTTIVNPMVIERATGNVGIRDANPDYNLDVGCSTSPCVNLVSSLAASTFGTGCGSTDASALCEPPYPTFSIRKNSSTTPVFSVAPLDPTGDKQIVLRVGQRAQDTGDSQTLGYFSQIYNDLPDACGSCEAQAVYGINFYKNTGAATATYLGVHGLGYSIPDTTSDSINITMGVQGYAAHRGTGWSKQVFGVASNAGASGHGFDECATPPYCLDGHVGNVFGTRSQATASDMPDPTTGPLASNDFGVDNVFGEFTSVACTNSAVRKMYGAYFTEPVAGTGCTPQNMAAIAIAKTTGTSRAHIAADDGATGVESSGFGYDFTLGSWDITSPGTVRFDFNDADGTPYSWRTWVDSTQDTYAIKDLTSNENVLEVGKSTSTGSGISDGSVGINASPSTTSQELKIVRNVGTARAGTMLFLGRYNANSPQIELYDGFAPTQSWKINSDETAFRVQDGDTSEIPFQIVTSTGEIRTKAINGSYEATFFATGLGTEASPYVNWEATLADKVADCIKANANEFYPNCEAYFPPGIYQCNTNNCLGQISTITGNKVWGMTFRGAGMFNTIIRPNPAGHCSTTTATVCTAGSAACPGGEYCKSDFTDFYFFDNCANAPTCTTTTPTYSYATFTDIGFEGSRTCTGSTSPACSFDGESLSRKIDPEWHGFRIVSTNATSSWEQGWKFTRVRFEMLYDGFQLLGDNTASEMSFFDCKFTKMGPGDVYYINNLQSINHNWYSTDAEILFGNLFHVGPLGGGAVSVYGGSIILHPHADITTPRYVMKLETGGSNTGRMYIDGVDFELRSQYTALIDSDDSTTLWSAVIRNSKLLATSQTMAADQMNTIGAATSLYIDKSTIKTQSTIACTGPQGVCSNDAARRCNDNGDCYSGGTCGSYPTHPCGQRFTFASAARNSQEGYVKITDSLVDVNEGSYTGRMEEYFDFADQKYGAAECSGCYIGPSNETFRSAIDFVVNGKRGSAMNQGGSGLKFAVMNAEHECWPSPINGTGANDAGTCFNVASGATTYTGLTGGHCSVTTGTSCTQSSAPSDCPGGETCLCDADADCPGSHPVCVQCDRFLSLPSWSALYEISTQRAGNVDGCGFSGNAVKYCLGNADKSVTYACTDTQPQSSPTSLYVDMQGKELGLSPVLRFWAEGAALDYNQCSGEPVRVSYR